jgi:peptidoglycan/LPS O-acetylase OafA/YrhL
MLSPALERSSERSWQRLDGVDLLRGLSILLVLMNHVNMQLLFADVPYTRGLPRQLVSSLVWNGQMGVQIFFAISGFLITSTSLRRWGSLAAVNAREFYQLRFARIAPLLLLLLAVLSSLHVAHVQHFVVSQKTGGLGRALLAAVTFHINWLEASRDYLPGNWDILWSLSVEEMFYLFFPLLCRMVRAKAVLVSLLCIFVVIGPFARSHAFNHNPVWREYSYLGGMDAIALGCLTAIGLDHRRLSRMALSILGVTGAAAMVLTLAFSNIVAAWGLEWNGLSMSILAVGACMVIACFADTGWQSPRLLAPLRRLGQRSYEVYLTHMFVVIVLAEIFIAAGKPIRGVTALFAGTILLSAVLGEVVGRSYAEPMNRWLRKQWKDDPATLGAALATAER